MLNTSRRAIAISAAVTLIVGACSGATVSPSPSPAASTAASTLASTAASPSAAASGKLSHWYYDFPPFANYQKQRAQEFMTANPGVTITYDSSIPPVGEGGYEDKITSSLAAGTAPDVFSVISPQAPRIISLNQLAPI